LGSHFRRGFGISFAKHDDPFNPFEDVGNSFEMIWRILDKHLLQVLLFLLYPVLENASRIV